MGSAGVRQLAVLAELFKRALDRCLPESVAVLEIAGGNGLEQIDCAATKRIVGVDINQRYLEEVQRRFDTLAGLELYCRDLGEQDFSLTPVALVHAALIFEHVGMGLALENALSCLASRSRLDPRATRSASSRLRSATRDANRLAKFPNAAASTSSASTVTP